MVIHDRFTLQLWATNRLFAWSWPRYPWIAPFGPNYLALREYLYPKRSLWGTWSRAGASFDSGCESFIARSCVHSLDCRSWEFPSAKAVHARPQGYDIDWGSGVWQLLSRSLIATSLQISWSVRRQQWQQTSTLQSRKRSEMRSMTSWLNFQYRCRRQIFDQVSGIHQAVSLPIGLHRCEKVCSYHLSY